MKKFSFLVALLCASIMSFAVDWSGVAWLGNGVGEGYTDVYKAVVSPELPSPGFINNLQKRNDVPVMHVVFPSAAFGAFSLDAAQYETEGAGVFFHLDAFPAKENEFTAVCSDVTYTFTVYNDKGVEAVGGDEATVLVDFPSVGSFNYVGTVTSGATDKYDNNTVTPADGIKFPNGFVVDGVVAKNYVSVHPAEGGFLPGDKVEVVAYFNNSDDTKAARLAFYNADTVSMDTLGLFVNGRTYEGVPPVQSFVIEEATDSIFIGRVGRTGESVTRVNVISLKITREAPVVVTPADRRIYAYGLNVEKDGENYKFSYNSNIDGTKAVLGFYKDKETILGEIELDAPKKGANVAVISPADIPEGEVHWGIYLAAGPVTEFAEIFTGADLKKCHLAIDNSPESDYFGRMYVANRAGTADGGVYVYDQGFNLVAENTLAGQEKWQSMGRPAVGADGTVYLADWGDAHGGIYVMDPATLNATSFFVGTQASSGLWTNAEGVAMGSSTAAVGVYGEGASTVLYAMNEDVPDDKSLYAHGVNVYQIGQADGSVLKTWDKAPTLAFALQDNAAQMFVINANEHGAFFSSSRSKGNNAAGARSLQFYNVKGERTFVALPEGATVDLTGSLGGGCAVSQDLSDLAIVDGDGNILVYAVTWTDDTPNLTFVKKYETPFAAIGSLSFDWAGNIVATVGANYNNSTANHLVVYSVPTDENSSIVPAKKSLTVTGTKPVVLLEAPDKAAPEPTWPENQVKAMYAPKYNADMEFGEWGSGTQYTQDTYGKKYVTTNLGYFGTTGFSLNCLNMEYLHYDIWVAENTTIRIVPIWGGVEQGVTVELTGQKWNEIDLDKKVFDKITDWGNIYQVKIDNAFNLTLWIGNAYFYRTTELADNEGPTNLTAEVDKAYYFNAVLKVKATDNSGAVAFNIYNENNVRISESAGASDKDVLVTINDLEVGTEYKFSVVASDDNGNLSDTVALTVKTLDAPAPAPAPTAKAEDVISLYSDAYDPATWYVIGGWEQTTVSTWGEIADKDEAYFLYNCNYLGWEIHGNVADFDATDYYAVHMDIYPVEGTSIQFTPIWGGEALKTKTLVEGQWNQVDFEFSLYDGINLANIYQFKWAEMPKQMLLDNVYIYKKVSDGVDDIKLKDNVQKILENGVIYIIRDGVRYNVMGVQVK